jgi:pyroglutamyl-peptidase
MGCEYGAEVFVADYEAEQTEITLKILMTGFEPWGDWDSNPSGEVAKSLDGEVIGGVEVVGAVLPVAYGEDIAIVTPLIEKLRPSAVVSLGLSRTSSLNVERVAINMKMDDQAIVSGGPDAYFATLPTRSMVEAIAAGGIPAKLSYHAGTFLCNHIMYSVLHHISQTGNAIPSGFIHIPPTPKMVREGDQQGEGMSLGVIREGTVLAVENLVGFLGRGTES